MTEMHARAAGAALSHLVANAIRHTPCGGAITVTIELDGGAADIRS